MTEDFIDLTAEEAVVAGTEMDIEVDEAIGWAAGDPNLHVNLPDRNDSDQHLISSITGLREELDQIKSLKTVYSDKIGVANYYKWANDFRYNDTGYFVSLVAETSTIEICKGSDIFGVTVSSAAFVGNQNALTVRDNSYGLVVTSGIVDVRCASDIEVGDYVVSNKDGTAQKTDSGCGYKVIALEEKADEVTYAVIALGVQACTTDVLGQRVGLLERGLEDAEFNIAAAMRIANDAALKAGNSDITSSDTQQKIDGVIDATNNMQETVDSALKDVDAAKKAAEDAVEQAEVFASQAVSASNEALAKAGEIEKTVEPIKTWEYTDSTGIVHQGAEFLNVYMKDVDDEFTNVQYGLSTKAEMETVSKLDEENKLLIEKNAESYQQLVSSVDKYCIGELSQSYGLTLEQARSILKPGMIYIPVTDIDTHTESYVVTVDGKEYSFEVPFTEGCYYIWETVTLKINTDDGEKDISGYWWNEHQSKVWVSTIMPQGPACEFWFDNTTLYKLEGANWTEFEKPIWTGDDAPTSEYDYWFHIGWVQGRYFGEGESNDWMVYPTATSETPPPSSTDDFWYDGETFHTHWFKVNTIAGNVNSRISSLIRQDVDAITAEIVTVHGSMAGFEARLNDVEATAKVETVWKDPVTGEETMSYIGLKSNDDGSSMSLTVRGKDSTAHETIAGITLAQDDNGSAVLIDADRIAFEGESVFKTENGQTVVDGGLIETGSIKADAITTGVLKSDGYVDGTTYSQVGTSFSLDDGTIKSTNFAVIDGKIHAKGADIEGTINAQNGKIGQFTVTNGYMNLMVSAPKNLVTDGNVVKYLTYRDTRSAKYYLDPNSNNGEIVLEDCGYIVPEKLYTILIDLKLVTNRSSISENDWIYVQLYNKKVDAHRVRITKVNEHYKIKQLFYGPGSDLITADGKDINDYLNDIQQDSATNAQIILTSPLTENENEDYIEIYEVRIVEGNHLDDIDASGLVTSDFASDETGMGWTITPDKCVWWNQTGSLADPLMRLDSDGLYVKGQIVATSGTFDKCTINSSCEISGTLKAVSGQIGCLTIDYDNKELYYESLSGTKEILINSSGVNIVSGQIGGWAFEEANNSLYGNYIYSSQIVTTTFQPETISLLSKDESTVNQSTTWANIINICKDGGRLDVLETRFLKLLKQADIDINTLDSVVLSE